MIEVLFFARAAELAGTARGELSPPLPSTLGELQERVLAGHGGLAPLAAHLLWAVDEEVVRDPGHPLHDGATVAVMPPYSGG